MHLVIAGSSGFLGSHLVTHLEARGHEVSRLVRREPTSPSESRWDPYAGTLDRTLVRQADVVVNLAGAPTAGNPHSKKWARELRNSRVVTTRVLADTIAGGTGKPTLVAGNAIGWYGDHRDREVTESTASVGDSFMTEVCREWQAATEPAAEHGSRVIVLRTSPVIDRAAPPLKQMLLPWRLGLGARLGDGSQFFPIVSLRDWLAAVTFLAESELPAGPYNVSCPIAPTNREFTQALASAVGRKARLAAPATVLRTLAGRLAPEVLGSTRVRPMALQDAGFEFRDHDAIDVIAAALS
ncbi:TIGR01777 family oxidoreductase [Nocardioides speluncae]|uniref:TIGR01777 family oxidoreductase n=1 Tax=Nocardioides speluncae TaxID=2670337 RepID=UPI000D689E24|nr:TIGR01777 family oxidoreductase [Nocardioides speluncae]